jgi:hypothetical protein
MLQQIRYALRSIAKRPSCAIVTVLVLVLTIAIGANTTVFSVLSAFLMGCGGSGTVVLSVRRGKADARLRQQIVR